MFTFKCQCCGVKMGDFPPVEALSVQQGYVIFDGDQPSDLTMMQDSLFGTPFEGLSAGQFCTFCLNIIVTYPKGIDQRDWSPKYNELHIDNQRVYDVRMSMNPWQGSDTKDYDNLPHHLQELAMWVLHHAGDGISWQKSQCRFPGCWKDVWRTDEHTWEGSHYCDDHKGYVSLKWFLETMKRDYHLRFWAEAAPYFGHNINTCECNDCQNAAIELWALEAEARWEEYHTGPMDPPDWDDDEEAF